MKLKSLIKKINEMLGEEKLILHYSLAFGKYKVKIKDGSSEKDLYPLGTKKEVYSFLLGIFQGLGGIKWKNLKILSTTLMNY